MLGMSKQGTPALVEDGMTLTHQIEAYRRVPPLPEVGTAARPCREEGDRLLLECQQCFQWHRIPDGIEWR
jgi:hypothetical protein